MWSDNDIDKAFQRLNSPEPEPAPFPLDAWLRLESQLDKEEVARTVRRKMWRLFALEVLVVALVGLGWLLWKPADAVAPATSQVAAASASRSDGKQLSATAMPRVMKAPQPRTAASASGNSAVESAAATTANSPDAAKSELPSTFTRDAASGNKHLAPVPGKPTLDLVTATPQRRSSSERRSADGQASRSVATVALAASDSRRTGRPTGTGPAQGERNGINSNASAQPASQTSSHASSGIPAIALAALGSPRRKTRPQAREASHAPVEAEETTAAATPTAGLIADTNAGAADNAELMTKTAALATAASPALPTSLGQVPETPLAAPAQEPRLYVGLVGAPDVTTVKFASVERPLLNLGLTVEYRFANRWRVTTGLLRANKEYYARREDYDWSAYPRAATRSFTQVEGACTVLDVPLNLRYDAVVRNHARWFGSVGLSSFFMHRERYAYDYLEGGYYTEWERSYVNENQHLFSILNLSAGYEHSLGRHWRVQAEPYYKLPLGGVGMGKVKLTSAGIFLGVKYGF